MSRSRGLWSGVPLRRVAGLISVLVVLLSVAAASSLTVVASAAFVATTGSVGNTLGADTLSPPTAVTATVSGSVTIDWTPTTDAYADGHRILRSTTAGGPYSPVADVTPRTTNTYEDDPPAGTHYYVVRAYAGAWESSDSNEATAQVVPQMMNGSYIGNSTDNRSIFGVGFQPAVVFIKCDCSVQGVVRTSTMTGDATKRLSTIEALVPNQIQSLDTDGFGVGTGLEVNNNGETYHYMAFRDEPTLGIGTYVGDGVDNRSITGIGFQPVLVTTFAAGDESVYRMGSMAPPDSYQFGGASPAIDKIKNVEPDGFLLGIDDDVNWPGMTYHYVAWQASATTAQATYTGDGVDNRSITGVGFQPEFVWVKRDTTSGARIRFATNSVGQSIRWGPAGVETNRIQALETDGFQIGSSDTVNVVGDLYHYVAFDGGP